MSAQSPRFNLKRTNGTLTTMWKGACGNQGAPRGQEASPQAPHAPLGGTVFLTGHSQSGSGLRCVLWCLHLWACAPAVSPLRPPPRHTHTSLGLGGDLLWPMRDKQGAERLRPAFLSGCSPASPHRRTWTREVRISCPGHPDPRGAGCGPGPRHCQAGSTRVVVCFSAKAS